MSPASRTIARSAAGAAVALAALLVPVPCAAIGQDAPPDEAPTVELALLETSGRKFEAWLLSREAALGWIVLEAGGALAIVPAAPAPAVTESTLLPLASLPGPSLVEGLAHAEREVRECCHGLLRELGAAATPHLGAALSHESAEARWRALALLAKKPAKQWQARVRERLRDPDEKVRRHAIAAYAALAPDDLARRCISLLQLDRSLLVRHEAIVQVGRTRDLTAVDALLDHLEDCEERSLELVTFDALRRLTGRRFGRDESAWRAWWTNHREELLEAFENA